MINGRAPGEDELQSLRVRVRNTYIESGKDDEIAAAMSYVVSNIHDFHAGAASPRRGIFIIGPAGTGKSWALKHAFKQVSDFQTYENEHGETVHPLISIKLPKRCTTKDLVVAVLEAMNLPHEGNETQMTEFMRLQFKERRVHCLHLDELQHTVRSNTRVTFEAVQDLLKSMLDIEDWPLHIILSGMPKIEKMREDDQIRRRSNVIPFHPMEFPVDTEWVAHLIKQVAGIGCGLELSADLVCDEFRERLCLATSGAWGTMIEMIQSASFRALERNRTVLTIRHFAKEYQIATGCDPSDNIFLAENFRDIDPKMSLASMMED
ncbi:type II secretory pathway predicted ATPase ExeA [Mesorhizobium soli]|uniref:ATP-binding protein n=1 Tax=Pseudaminobacter soli (ex Li et al. 2025) TaxID=1295366 RepID=UPI002475F843|nr:ATP-binding protein [Mesorhizobium soli]MDH6231607.1 type II secretory pathway predicted ATPase ExeA [Mesorhizobium soli]